MKIQKGENGVLKRVECGHENPEKLKRRPE
ncbi:hypothetical protein JOC86_001698 [Bacillus pakistanensis]|uniref:Uncharacterized protein n=1 Tax=Rossellomorea pakistanensis TaxID=992288 RepID=A0ABS2NBD5_9BACI|nr:hypothetical protein [Bacillus pakistanensis]